MNLETETETDRPEKDFIFGRSFSGSSFSVLCKSVQIVSYWKHTELGRRDLELDDTLELVRNRNP